MSSFWSAVRSKKSAKNAQTEDIGKPPSGRSSKMSHTEPTIDEENVEIEIPKIETTPAQDNTTSEDQVAQEMTEMPPETEITIIEQTELPEENLEVIDNKEKEMDISIDDVDISDQKHELDKSKDEITSTKRQSRISRFKEQIRRRRAKSSERPKKNIEESNVQPKKNAEEIAEDKSEISSKPPSGIRFRSPFSYFRSQKPKEKTTEKSEPPIPDSPKPIVKGFRKRAASASPSRQDGEHRKIFRGLNRENLIGPLPTPVKNFLFNRRSQSEPRDNEPMKPSRRPGPLGRSWVKVYDDITYVDDPSSVDFFPIPGYTGKPTKVPDAQPLPKAPTPPPQKEENNDLNVGKIVEQNVTNNDEAPRNLSPTFSDNSDKNVELNPENSDHKNQESEETDLTSLPLIESSPKTKPKKSKNRDFLKFKSKKNKRPPTPSNSAEASISNEEGTINVQTDMDSHEPSQLELPKEDESMEVEGKGTETSSEKNKSKPKKNKSKGQVALSEEVLVEQLVMNPSPVKENKAKKIKTLVTKPQEGDPVVIEKTKVVSTFIVRNKGVELSDISIPIPNETMNEEPMPPKPKRKPKYYENVEAKVENLERASSPEKNLSSKNHVDLDTAELQETASETTNKSSECPKEKLMKCKKDDERKVTSSMENEPPKIMKPEAQDKNQSNDKNDPEYATVSKDRTSNSVNERLDVENVPPPIPPKKKSNQGSKVLSNVDEQPMPPRPPRHLKPRTRSLDPSPSREHKKRALTLLNANIPPRPERGTKIYSGFSLKGSTPINQTPQIVRRRINHKERPLPAPPRKKKLSRELVTEPAKRDDHSNDHQLHAETDSSVHVGTEATPPPPIEKRKKRGRSFDTMSPLHANRIDTVEKTQPNSEPLNTKKFPTPSTDDLILPTDSELDKEIDLNLKNIEESFNTLDTALASLHEYSRRSPVYDILEKQRRRSCDVCFNASPTPLTLENEREIIRTNIANIELIPSARKSSQSPSGRYFPTEEHISLNPLNSAETSFLPYPTHVTQSTGVPPDSNFYAKEPNQQCTFDEKILCTETASIINRENLAQGVCNDYNSELACKDSHRTFIGQPIKNEVSPTVQDSPDIFLSRNYSPCLISESSTDEEDTNIILHEISSKRHDYFTGDQLSSIHSDAQSLNNSIERQSDEDQLTECSTRTSNFLDDIQSPNLEPISYSPNPHSIKTFSPVSTSTFNDDIDPYITTAPIRSQVVLGLEPEFGSQITAQTHHLVTDFSLDSLDSNPNYDDEKVSAYLSTIPTAYRKNSLEDDQIDLVDNDTVTLIEDSEEEESSNEGKRNVLLLGPIAGSNFGVGKARNLDAASSQIDTSKTQDNELKETPNLSIFEKYKLHSHDLEEPDDSVQMIARENVLPTDNDFSQSLAKTLLASSLIQNICTDILNEALHTVVGRSELFNSSFTSSQDINSESVSSIGGRSLSEDEASNLSESFDLMGNIKKLEHANSLNEKETYVFDYKEMLSTLMDPSEIAEAKPDSNSEPRMNHRELLHGVATITGQLEGLTYQIEDVLTGFRGSISSDDYSSETLSSSNTSNRSSIDVDLLDSESTTTFYSMSQPSMSNYSLLSYYTALSPSTPSPDISDSRASSPTLQEPLSADADEDDSVKTEEDMGHSDSQSSH